jgi:MFS family permease
LLQIYALRALAGLGKVLFAITLPVLLSRWFSRRFAFAAAIMFSGWYLGGLGLASITQYGLSTIGWRATSIALGLAQLAIALPVVLVVLRLRSAADRGLPLDGNPAEGLGQHHQESDASPTLPKQAYPQLVRQLARDALFRIVVIATPIYYLVYGGVLLQQAAIVQGFGASADAASWVVGLTAGCAAVGAVAGGWVIDRSSFVASTLMIFALIGSGIVLLLLASANASPLFFAAHAVSFGVGIGAGDIFWISSLKRKFAPHLFTSAWGIWYFLQLAVLVVAPAVSGAIVDFTSSYTRMLEAELVLLATAFVLSFLLAMGGTRAARCASL